MGERTRKLLTLRARTDHDLLILVNRELDHGYALLDVATTRNSSLFAQAEKASCNGDGDVTQDCRFKCRRPPTHRGEVRAASVPAG